MASFWRLIVRVGILGALLGIGGVLAVLLVGKEALSILYRRDYAEHMDAFIWITVAAGVDLRFRFSATVNGAHRFRVQVTIFAISLVTTACASLLLIPSQGLVGAGQVVLITSIVQWFVVLVVMVRIKSSKNGDVVHE